MDEALSNGTDANKLDTNDANTAAVGETANVDGRMPVAADDTADATAETESPTEGEVDATYFVNADGQKLYRRYWRPDLKEGERPR